MATSWPGNKDRPSHGVKSDSHHAGSRGGRSQRLSRVEVRPRRTHPAGVRDDQRGAITVAGLLERYMREELPALKPRTAVLYAGYTKNHVVPALGRKSARDVTFSDIAKLHRAIGAAGAKVAANRVTSFVSAVYAWAGRAGEVPRGDESGARCHAIP